MKHLRIEVNGSEWVNGEFAEVSFTDGPNGVKIEGRIAREGGGGGSLLDLFAAASKARTEAVVEERRASLDLDPVEISTPEPVDPL